MEDDDDDSDDRQTLVAPGIALSLDRSAEIGPVFDDLEALLKDGDVISTLTARGVNASIALVAVEGLRAYLAGRKEQAADDLGTAVDEIRGRLRIEPG